VVGCVFTSTSVYLSACLRICVSHCNHKHSPTKIITPGLHPHSPACPPTADPTVRCRLANLGPLSSSNIEVSYNPQRMSFDPLEGALVLQLEGTDGGRVHVADGDFLHGLWQWDVKPSGAVGAVTGAYLRSDYNQETQDYSEIE